MVTFVFWDKSDHFFYYPKQPFYSTLERSDQSPTPEEGDLGGG